MESCKYFKLKQVILFIFLFLAACQNDEVKYSHVELEKNFNKPPMGSYPLTWWHWMNGNSILDSYEWWFNHKDRRWGYINDKPFTNYFFFHHLPVQKTDVKVIIESTEPVFIESLQVFAAPDAMYREFEKGLVITNPGLHPYIFDLTKLSPGNSYRRIKGTESQDIETNNGKPVSEKVTLEKHDALFLIKE